MKAELDKYFSGELNQEEKKSLLRKVMEDESLRDEFAKTQNLIALANLIPQREDYDLAQSGLLEFRAVVRSKKRKKLIFNLLKYAASIAIIVLSTWFVSEKYFQLSANNSYIEIEVPQGYRTFVRLDDGSTLWLNSRSKLRYPNHFGEGNRVVMLDGEAFFNVEKNDSKPFVVKTTRYNVAVLGTKFNVLNYSEKPIFETTLLEGSVKVFRNNEEKTGILLAPNEQMVMKNGILEKRKIEQQDLSLWEDGYFVFDNEQFENIMCKLELYYNVKFLVRNEKALYNSYTGNFNSKEGIVPILEAIQKVQKFSFDMSSDKKIVYIN